MSYFCDNIDAMSAYVPGEQPAAGQRVIKLNQNENAYPPSPAVAKAMAAFDSEQLRIYSDPMARPFAAVVAKVLDIPADWILPGDGSDDLIQMIVRAAAGPGRAVVIPTPTFPFYRTQAVIENADIVEIPSGRDFSLPIEKLAAANGAVTFIANPNTPSGLGVSAEAMESLARHLSGLLVIDEAYADFAEGDCLDLVRRCENVVILRTLSKAYSLASLRLGFGIAQPAVLAGLLKTKSIYNVGAIPAAIGAAAFADQAYKNATVAKILASRADLVGKLTAMGWQVWPSQANFILVRPPAGNAAEINAELRRRGILLRYFSNNSLADKLRISIGTDEQQKVLLDALRELA